MEHYTIGIQIMLELLLHKLALQLLFHLEECDQKGESSVNSDSGFNKAIG